jgi:hypothetical protein
MQGGILVQKGSNFPWTMALDVRISSLPEERMRLSGWIYAVREDDAPLIKVGCTRRGVLQRMQSLARQLHFPFIVLGVVSVRDHIFEIERRIHRLLHAERIAGEWFYLSMSQARLEHLVAQALGVSTDYLLGLQDTCHG